jgi:predicted DNA-binding transcriptional regulator AlpA
VARPNRKGTMNNFVETWKSIATALGRSERWCRYMAQRAPDPLPVFKIGGIVRLNQSDLDDWLSRQRGRSLARPVFEALINPAPVSVPTPLKLIA